MEEGERNQMLNIAKICDILTWAFKEINLLDEGGIRKQIPMP
jgi:hypothetical protein